MRDRRPRAWRGAASPAGGAPAAGPAWIPLDAGDAAAAVVHPRGSDALVRRSRLSRYGADVGHDAARRIQRRARGRGAVDARARRRHLPRRARGEPARSRKRTHPCTIGAMSSKRFAGVFTPIATPFTSEDRLDEKALAGNVRRWMTTPLTGLVVLGSNGEAPQLEEEEADRVIEIVRAGVPKDRPLIVGTGRESTKATIAATRSAADLGADAALVRTPSFFKNQMTSEIFMRHYAEVADASRIPILLYNVTMYTSVTLGADAVEQLSAHPNIAGMKESGNDLLYITECINRTPDDFTVLAGSATTLFQSLCAGCDGAVLALAALIPDECVQMVKLVKENRIAEARALQRRVTPLARSIGGGFGIICLQAALDLLGFNGGLPRPPLRPASKQIVETIRGQLDALGVLPVRV